LLQKPIESNDRLQQGTSGTSYIPLTKPDFRINGLDMAIGYIVPGWPVHPYPANKNICNAGIYNVILILAQKSSRFNELNPL
jgi:hypothetical protein